MTVTNTLPFYQDLNLFIYSFLDTTNLLTLRRVSILTKSEIDKMPSFKQLLDKINIIKQLQSKQFHSSFTVYSPKIVHSNGRSIRVLSWDGARLYNNSLSDPIDQFVKLPQITAWKKTYWNDTRIAIHSPQLPIGLKKHQIQVWDIENGKKLREIFNSYQVPIGWYNNEHLLMSTKDIKDYYFLELSSWKISSEDPLTVLANLPNGIINIKTCHNGSIYCLANVLHPFFKMDVETLQCLPLPFELPGKRMADQLKNFGVTSKGHIYFSEDKAIYLSNETDTKPCITFNTSIHPTNIAFHANFMGCYEGHSFLVYDIRKPLKPFYEHDYLTIMQKIKIATTPISYLPFFRVPYFEISIQSMTFHHTTLCIGKGNTTLDLFNLSKAKPRVL